MRILIVDDEPIIREWFQMTVAKLGGNYQIVGEAANGNEAVDFCRNHPVDLVVTDVKMPGMNGIELIKRLREERPGLRSVIFSSYNEFQFAAEALKLGVSEYILKAEITLQGLSDILEKIRKDMELERTKTVEINSLRSLVNQSQLALRTVYFRELLQGGAQAEQVFEEKMDLFQTGLSEKNLAVMALGILRSPRQQAELKIKEDELLQLALSNIVDETLRNEAGNGCLFHYEEDVYMLLVNIPGTGMKSQRESLLLLASRVAENLRKFIGVESAIGISTVYSRLSYVTEQAREALEALNRHLFYEDRSIACFEAADTAAQGNRADAVHRLETDAFLHRLELGQTAEASAELERLLDDAAHSKRLPARQVRAVVLELVYAALNRARVSQVPPDRLDGLYGEAHVRVSELMTFRELRAWTEEALGQVLGWIEASRRRYGDAVQKACDYIGLHYAEEIPLQAIADHVHLSRNYFSELFKKETGLNFNEYVMQVRMERATLLLKEKVMKVSDASAQVGYANVSYFIKLFKKHTGLSPLEYMETYTGHRGRG